MTTKAGVIVLIVGGYLIALGIGGINAASGGTKWLFSLILVIGFVVMGWAMILPWDEAGRQERAPGADR